MESGLKEKICRIGICDKDALEIQNYTNFFNQWLNQNRGTYPNLKSMVF